MPTCSGLVLITNICSHGKQRKNNNLRERYKIEIDLPSDWFSNISSYVLLPMPKVQSTTASTLHINNISLDSLSSVHYVWEWPQKCGVYYSKFQSKIRELPLWKTFRKYKTYVSDTWLNLVWRLCLSLFDMLQANGIVSPG